MTDIFLSYSQKDQERAGVVRDELVEHGFSVFWDQTIPDGMDWNVWIRDKLTYARVAVVLWTHTSTKSDAVIHEAELAHELGKRIPVWLDELKASDFKLLGQFTSQAIKLTRWTGGACDRAEASRLLHALEARLTPRWATRRFDQLEARLASEVEIRKAIESSEAAKASARESLAEELDVMRRERDRERAKNERIVAASVKDREALDAASAREAALRREAGGFADALERAASDTAELRLQIGKLEAELNAGRPAGPRGASNGALREWPHVRSPHLAQRLLRIEPGRFTMTCYRRSPEAEIVRLPLEIDYPFVVSETLVSSEDWRVTASKDRDGGSANGAPDVPCTNISFEEVREFLDALNARAGGGFYLMTEKEWFFVHHRLDGVAPAQDGALPALFEWLGAAWPEYGGVVEADATGNLDAPGNPFKLSRADVMAGGSPDHLNYRQRWLQTFRSETLGFRVARRV